MHRRTFLTAGTVSAALGVTPTAVFAVRGAVPARSVIAKSTANRVTISDFGTGLAALQRAMDTSVREVVVDTDVTVSADVVLRSDQTLRFAGGRIIVAANATIANAVLHNSGGANIGLLNLQIDASAKQSGVTGVKLVNVTGARIEGGKLNRANLWIESDDNSVDRRFDIAGLTIDMAGWLSTAVYLSCVRGVDIHNSECFGGREGIGIYNGARDIKISAVRSHDHTQDGFVIIDGKQIDYVDCLAKGNGQSGFCTQDLSPGMGAQFVNWTNCEANNNAADGFDIHGLKGAIDSEFRLMSCVARKNGPANGGCGFYILTAPGTLLQSCSAYNNRFQGLFINSCDRLIAKDFRSVSNADTIETGPNKAGILVYNSDAVRIESPVSGNHKDAAQEYGLSFTGTTKRARVIGGNLLGNRIRPVFAEQNVVLPAEDG